MVSKLKNIGVVVKDAKSRTILIVILVIALIIIGIGYFLVKRGEPETVPASAQLTGAPGIKSIPATGTPSAEYARLQEQENIQRAQEAMESGKSALPTLIKSTYIGPTGFSQPSGSPECSPDALSRARAAGVKADELRCKGCDADALRAAGYTAGELMNAGYSANDLKAAGFSVDELREAGFTANELARAGFTASEMASAGYNAAELNQAGLGADQLAAAGLTAQQIAAAGIGVTPTNLPKDCSVDALRTARANGVSAAELRGMGCGAAALRAAGYTASELKAAGFSAQELSAAGFSAQELKDAGFSAGDLRQAGFAAADLESAGYGADEMRNAGYEADDLAAAGYSRDELAAAGFSNGELARAGLGEAVTATPITTTQQSSLPAITAPADANLDALEKLQQRQAEQLSLQERQDRITQLQQTMQQQASDLLVSWAPPAQQQYTAGEEEQKQSASAASSGQQASTTQTTAQTANQSGQLPVIKAGTVMFGTLETSLNSDEPGPVLATIVDGPYKGARLVGAFELVDKKVVLTFNTMNIPSQPQSITIDAVAIDPNTARTALASNVDNHYMLRYGTLFASSFLTGLGNAVGESGSTTNITLGGISTTNPGLTTAEQGLVALGEVGQQFGNALSPLVNRPPTVTVRSGQGIGLLFRSDVTMLAAAPAGTQPPSSATATATTATSPAAPTSPTPATANPQFFITPGSTGQVGTGAAVSTVGTLPPSEM